MESAFFRDYKASSGSDHQTTYQRAVTLMKSKEAKAFDLSLEPSAAREKYGSGQFANGCLLARRLVEVGVPFVEVTLGGWDTHQDNWTRVKNLSGQVDTSASVLLADLNISDERFPEALDAARKAVAENPRDEDALARLAASCRLLVDPIGAAAAEAAALANNPRPATSYAAMGERRGRHDDIHVGHLEETRTDALQRQGQHH